MKKIDNYEIYDFIKTLIKTRLDCGENLLKLTEFNNTCMWWTADTLFCDFFLKRKLNGQDPNAVRLNNNLLLKLAFNSNFIILYKYIGIYILFIYNLLLKSIISIVVRSRDISRNPKSANRILFVSQDTQWKSVITKNGSRKTDLFFDQILLGLSETGFEPIGINLIYLNPIIGLKVFIDKNKNWAFQQECLNMYWTINAFLSEVNALKYFDKKWEFLANDKKFRDLCCIEGLNLYDEILMELRIYFYILFPFLIQQIEMCRLLIRDKKPRLMILLAGSFWWERAIVIAAKLERIPTLAIQHGVFSGDNKSYMYTEDEISRGGSIEYPYCQIPDRFAVFGNYYKELLTEFSAYPESSVIVTGSPKYDHLVKSDFPYSKDDFLAKFGIPSYYKIILWTTQCHDLDDSENIRNLSCISASIKSLDNALLIIRQHPNETKEHTKRIHDYIQKYQLKALLMPRTLDIYELLYSCDLLMTKHSTTAVEALILDKPVLILNLSGRPDVIDFVKEGVAKGVYDEDDLEDTIKSLLANDSDLKKMRPRYLYKYLYNKDGNATARVIELIKEIAKKD